MGVPNLRITILAKAQPPLRVALSR